LLVVVMAAGARAEGLVVAPATSPGVPFTIGPATTVITGPVGKDGLPDYAAALNERYGKGVTAENNAAVLWVGLMGDGILTEDIRSATLRDLGTTPTPATSPTWSTKDIPANLATTASQLWKPTDFPAIVAFLKERESLLDRLVDLSKKPRWFWPATNSPELLYLYTGPRYGGASDLLRALASRATQRAAANDFPGFQRDTLAILNLSKL
jgi:hypothetical protein